MTRIPPAFDTTIHVMHDHVVVSVIGEFDLTKVEAFEASRASIPTDARRVVVDIDAVTLLDSAALGAILRLDRDGRLVGRPTTVRATQRYQYRLFEVTGLGHLLDGVEFTPTADD